MTQREYMVVLLAPPPKPRARGGDTKSGGSVASPWRASALTEARPLIS